MTELSKEEQKTLMKEALEEWLDRQFALFGRWALVGLLSLVFAATLYLWLYSGGFHRQ